jgi:hypothetical protein
LAWQADVGRASHAAERWRTFADAHLDALAAERSAPLPLHRSMLRSLWHWRLARERIVQFIGLK